LNLYGETAGSSLNVFDMVLHNFDTTNNGFYDLFIADVDTTGDGIFDTRHVEQYIDTNGNGVIDKIIYGVDVTQNGVFDSVRIYTDYNETGMWELAYLEYTPLQDGSLALLLIDIDLQNFNPFDPTIDHSNIAGDPAADMEFWRFQGNTDRCALYVQKFAIEALTGQEIDMTAFAQTAERYGWFFENGGTPIEHVNKMLDYYSVENTVTFGGSLFEIEETLNAGGKVIVAVNGDLIAEVNYDSQIYAPNNANHVVQVIGVNNNDQPPTIIINDSGHPDGRGVVIPLRQFIHSWGGSGNLLVMTT
jgi:hypothetical protein